jgi:hypothetical protein
MLGLQLTNLTFRHCEARSDEAIHNDIALYWPRELKFARDDEYVFSKITGIKSSESPRSRDDDTTERYAKNCQRII